MGRLLLIALLFLARAEEGARLLEKYNGKFLAGWEIELTPPQLERIVRYFDFEKAWRLHGHRYEIAELDGYLSVPGAIEALPDDLRREAEAIRDRKSLILLDGGAEESLRAERLQEWWAKLPEARRREVARPEHLPDAFKAKIFSHRAGDVTLAKGVPEGVERLFSRLEWIIDQDTVEFRLRKPMEDLAELERMRDLMGRIAQISRGFDDTKEVPKNGGASYHIHVSTKDGRDRTELLRLLNLVLAARLDAGGRTDIWGNGLTAFKPDIGLRGVLRQIAPDRFEIRAHSAEPAEELAGVLELLSLPEKVAVERLRAELSRTLTPEVIARIAARTREPEKLLGVARVLHTHGLGDRLPLDGSLVREAYREFLDRGFTSGLALADKVLGQGEVATRMKQDLARLALLGRDAEFLRILSAEPLRLWMELSSIHWALNRLSYSEWPAQWRDPAMLQTLEGLKSRQDLPASTVDDLASLLRSCAVQFRALAH